MCVSVHRGVGVSGPMSFAGGGYLWYQVRLGTVQGVSTHPSPDIWDCRDTVKQVVRILLECLLVVLTFVAVVAAQENV